MKLHAGGVDDDGLAEVDVGAVCELEPPGSAMVGPDRSADGARDVGSDDEVTGACWRGGQDDVPFDLAVPGGDLLTNIGGEPSCRDVAVGVPSAEVEGKRSAASLDGGCLDGEAGGGAVRPVGEPGGVEDGPVAGVGDLEGAGLAWDGGDGVAGLLDHGIDVEGWLHVGRRRLDSSMAPRARSSAAKLRPPPLVTNSSKTVATAVTAHNFCTRRRRSSGPARRVHLDSERPMGAVMTLPHGGRAPRMAMTHPLAGGGFRCDGRTRPRARPQRPSGRCGLRWAPGTARWNERRSGPRSSTDLRPRSQESAASRAARRHRDAGRTTGSVSTRYRGINARPRSRHRPCGAGR